jgi:hypothetical protein
MRNTPLPYNRGDVHRKAASDLLNRFQMHDDDFEDGEDWYDDESADEPTVPCPECGEPVAEIADRCAACGYWLTESDRRRLTRHATTPTWVKLTAAVVLVAMLVGIATFMF